MASLRTKALLSMVICPPSSSAHWIAILIASASTCCGKEKGKMLVLQHTGKPLKSLATKLIVPLMQPVASSTLILSLPPGGADQRGESFVRESIRVVLQPIGSVRLGSSDSTARRNFVMFKDEIITMFPDIPKDGSILG